MSSLRKVGYAFGALAAGATACVPTRAAGGAASDVTAANDTPVAWLASSNRVVFRRVLKSFNGDVATTACALTGIYSVAPTDSPSGEEEVRVGGVMCDAVWQEDHLALSPDARYLVHTRFGPHGELMRLDLNDLTQSAIARSCSAPSASPSWAPGGGMIAFASLCDRPDELPALHIVLADGTREWAVGGPGDSAGDATPTWAPDGRRLAFARSRPSQSDIVTIDTGGTIERVVGPGFSPAWSPTGEWIAVLSASQVSQERRSIVLIRPDGSDRRVLLDASDARLPAEPNGLGRIVGPLVWAPGGNAVAFAYADAVWIVSLEGPSLRRLTRGTPPARGSADDPK